MTTRADLKPKQRLLVIDILQSLSMDVSKWADMKGGAARASRNPKYCYNWSFLQPGEFVVACLWHESLKQRGDEIYYEIKRAAWTKPRTEPGSGSANKRANDLDQHIWFAYSEALPLRIIFVEGKHSDGSKPSAVKARRLDDTPWAVKEYDCQSASNFDPVSASNFGSVAVLVQLGLFCAD